MIKKIFSTAFALIILVIASIPVTHAAEDNLSLFENIVDLSIPTLVTPTVVELTFPRNIQQNEIAIVRVIDQQPQPVVVERDSIKANFMVVSDNQPTTNLDDSNFFTFDDFVVDQGSVGTAKIELTFIQDTPVSGVTLSYDQFSERPNSIAISSSSFGQEHVLVSTTQYTGDTIRFPERTVGRITIFFDYTQPLRISEVSVIQPPRSLAEATSVRFLAKPNESYQLYMDPVQPVRIQTTQAGNLFAEDTRIRIPESQLVSRKNPAFRLPDSDEDGLDDQIDNCPNITNPEQEDINGNGIGDLCDDTDFDGVINTEDNCPDDANSDQRDVDDDGLGDICDPTESRFTEQYPWLPWVAIGTVAVVISVLVVVMVKSDMYSKKMTESMDVAVSDQKSEDTSQS